MSLCCWIGDQGLHTTQTFSKCDNIQCIIGYGHAGEQLAIEGILLVALETTVLRIDLQQPMDRLCLAAGRFRHALGRPSSRRAKEEFQALCRENPRKKLATGHAAIGVIW